jgi:hypothetical protein
MKVKAKVVAHGHEVARPTTAGTHFGTDREPDPREPLAEQRFVNERRCERCMRGGGDEAMCCPRHSCGSTRC